MPLEVFDPPLCCPSGVCGPTVDPELASFSADIDWLTQQGVAVNRFNLAQQPQAFVANPKVAAMLREAGDVALPLVLWQGQVIATGRYPSREALAIATGLTPATTGQPARAGMKVTLKATCEPGSGCCS
jgi:hypothetical protein